MLPFDRWLDLQELAMKIFSGPVGEFLASLNGGNLMDFDTRQAPDILASMVKSLKRKPLEELLQTMGKCVRADGKVLNWERQKMYWRSHMADLVPVVVLFLEVQFKDFFDGLRKGGATLLEMLPEAESQKE